MQKHMNQKMEMIADMKVPSVCMEDDLSADLFEQYEHHVSDSSFLHVFLARRKGRGHLAKGQPCQDYGFSKPFRYGMIITAADGLGSCARSDTGSRFACESAADVIAQLADESANEISFIHKMCKPFTLRTIVSEWMHRVKKDCALIQGKEPEDIYQASADYSTTLMYAVITEHYMFGANMGDGQVLFYNHDTSYRLRTHGVKNSPVTDCLHDPRSWSEGFQTAVFKRGMFSGILLSTDGIYDFLSDGRSFHHYANQLTERFLSAGKPEHPFDYMTDDGIIHHLYENGTFDDCTVHLAVLLNPAAPDPVQHFISHTFSDYASDRMTDSVRKYHVIKDGTQRMLISSGGTSAFHVKNAQLAECIEETVIGGKNYALYDQSELTSVEEMYHSACFNMNRSQDPKKLMKIVLVYQALKNLADELAGMNLRLNDAAVFLSGFDASGALVIYKEAVSKVRENGQSGRYSAFGKYFRNLYGALTFENRKYPVFRYGFGKAANTVYRFDGLGSSVLGILKRSGRQYVLINQSGMTWTDQNGKQIREGEALSLCAHCSFSFQARNDIRITYHFVMKEDL